MDLGTGGLPGSPAGQVAFMPLVWPARAAGLGQSAHHLPRRFSAAGSARRLSPVDEMAVLRKRGLSSAKTNAKAIGFAETGPSTEGFRLNEQG